jgi:hypothetical protein
MSVDALLKDRLAFLRPLQVPFKAKPELLSASEGARLREVRKCNGEFDGLFRVVEQQICRDRHTHVFHYTLTLRAFVALHHDRIRHPVFDDQSGARPETFCRPRQVRDAVPAEGQALVLIR